MVFTVIGGNIELASPGWRVFAGAYLSATHPGAFGLEHHQLAVDQLAQRLPVRCSAATPFIMNDARIATWAQLYSQSIAGINGVDWYSGSTMKVRVR